MLETIAAYLPTGGNYWLTRFLLLRVLGLTFFFAFISTALQAVPLLGKNGITPATRYLRAVKRKYGGNYWWKHPTLFWWWNSDNALKVLSWTGVILSLLLTFGLANVPILFLLWFIYLSFVHIGQTWYGYGWESQLLETAFLAIFFVPLLNPSPFSTFAPPFPIILLFLWLAFRLYMGAGLIKLKADSCWRDLTALNFHFETQPLPNPLSRYFHFLPELFKKAGVLMTHFVQIIVPIFIFLPGEPRAIAGALMIGFQIILMLSGNLSFLNLVSIAPMIAAFDDALLAQLLPDYLVWRAGEAASSATGGTPWLQWMLLAVIAVLSVRVVKNLLSERQVMNTTFDQFHIVNTYGAFGAVGRKRYELVIKGTSDRRITKNTEWKEYKFPAKPTDVDRTPPVIAPYQPRIDWQLWFAAMQTPRHNSWMITFIWKLFHNDKDTLKLVRENPFEDEPPKNIKVDRYVYKFAKPGSGKVWKRKKIGEWLPVISKKDLENHQKMMEW